MCHYYKFKANDIWNSKIQGQPGGGGSGIPVYLKKIRQNTQNSSKYTQNYTQVYLIPEIQRKWYTQYPYLSCNIPYTRFKKPLYTVYPKTLADPKDSYQSLLKYWSLFFISPETNMFVSFTKRKNIENFLFQVETLLMITDIKIWLNLCFSFFSVYLLSCFQAFRQWRKRRENNYFSFAKNG